jgi:hypothetical protein
MALFSNLGGGDLALMQQQLDEKRSMDVAQLSSDQIYKQMAYAGGSGLTRGIGGLLGADMVDPELKRKSLRARIVSEINPEDEASLKAGVENLQKAGFAEDAFALSARLLERQKKTAEITSEQALAAQRGRERQAASIEDKTFVELAKKATPRSVAVAMQAGNDISLLEIPEAVKVSTYGQILKDAGFKEGTPEFQAKMKTFAEAELKSTAQGKGTTITNVLPGIAKAGDVTSLRKDLQAITKPYQDQADAAGDAIDLANMAIKSNNFAAVSSLSRSLAKAAGETQLSGKDVEAFGIDPSLVGSVADTVSKLAKSRPTVDTLTKLRQLAEALKKKAESRISIEEQQLQETARVSGQFTEPQINTVFRRRPAPPANNQKTTRSGVTYTVEKD